MSGESLGSTTAINHRVGGFGQAFGIIVEASDVVMQRALVPFQRQNMVAALLDHLGRDRALAVERVNGRCSP